MAPHYDDDDEAYDEDQVESYQVGDYVVYNDDKVGMVEGIDDGDDIPNYVS